MNHVDEVLASPECMTDIFNHVANGGNLLTLAKMWKVPVYAITGWLMETPERKKKWADAEEARAVWQKEAIIGKLTAASFARIADITDDNGHILPVSEWPEALKDAASNIEVNEEVVSEQAGEEKLDHTTTVRKVKLIDSLKAQEMLGTAEGRLFKRQIEVGGKLDLDTLVMSSLKEAVPPAAPAE